MRLSLALYTWSSFDNQNNAPCTYHEYDVEHQTLSIKLKINAHSQTLNLLSMKIVSDKPQM